MMTSRTSAEQANILKENALIKRAAKGESQALKELFIKYLPMTLAELKGYNLRHYDDDWRQEAYIAFYKACCTYNPGVLVRFSTYYRCCLSNHLKSIMRRELAAKRSANHKSVSLDDDLHYLELVTASTPHEVQQTNEILEEFIKELSPFEYVCYQVLKGEMTMEMLLIQTGDDLKKANRGLGRVRYKFRKFIKKWKNECEN